MMYRSVLAYVLATAFSCSVALPGVQADSLAPEWMPRRLLPDHCEEITSKVPTPCPEPPPPKLPKMCAGIFGKWSGDPHFRTFDGLKFDCMGEGEFTVLKSLDSAFELQGRFGKFRSNRRPTVTTAIAFQTGDGEPKLQVSVIPNDSQCTPNVYIGGVKQSIGDGRTSIDGITIQKAGRHFTFFYEESEVQLQTRVRGSRANGCVMDTDICIPDCYARSGERFVGLLGTPDGNKDNDWTSADGQTVFDVQPTNRKEYEYCVQNWCIRDEPSSLFTYEQDSFADYLLGCDLPAYDDDDCVVDRAVIEEICGEGNRECIVDGCVRGEDAAKEYVIASLNQVDRNCGKELVFEDFDNDFNYGEWGTQESSVRQKNATSIVNAEKKTKYLSLHRDNAKLTRNFGIPENIAAVKIEYLFYEIGGWEASGGLGDYLRIKLNDVQLAVGGFNGDQYDQSQEGVKEGIAWSLKTVTLQGDLGFGGEGKKQTCAGSWRQCGGKYGDGSKYPDKCCANGWYCKKVGNWWSQCNPQPSNKEFWKQNSNTPGAPTDQIYKITLTVPESHFSSTNSLEFVMEADMTGGRDDESAGVDDVRVIAFSEDCKIDCDGVTVVYEDFDQEEDAADWGSTEKLADGHTVLGSILADRPEISKKFGVSPGAGYAKVEFLLYVMGSWTENDASKFWVNIGGVLFDVARFKEYETAGFVRKSEAADGGIKWERRPLADQARLLPDDGGEIHSVSIEVSSAFFSSGYLTVGLDVEAVDEFTSAAVDDLRIRLFPLKDKCEQAKKEEEQNTCPKKEEEEKVCYKDMKEEVCSPTAAPTSVPTSAPTLNPTTMPPTTAPTERPPITSSSGGDPHFATWGSNGTKFDFHGGCDLVLVQNDGFANGLGLHTHIRTRITTWWSFIESAAVRVGDHTLEVSGGEKQASYWLDGVEVAEMETGSASLGDFPIHFTRITDHQGRARIDLGHDGTALSIETFKQFVKIHVKAGAAAAFEGSHGMLGSYPGGQMVARDKVTIVEDANEFGQAWQVLATDPKLFHSEGPVQQPMKCMMPDTTKKSQKRRLGESMITKEEAALACARASQGDHDACIFDVLATNDLDMAGSY